MRRFCCEKGLFEQEKKASIQKRVVKIKGNFFRIIYSPQYDDI